MMWPMYSVEFRREVKKMRDTPHPFVGKHIHGSAVIKMVLLQL